MYYDKYGHPIDVLTWADLIENRKYSVIKQTDLGNGFVVSSVWIGIANYFKYNKPVIFETMLFLDGKEYVGETRQTSYIQETLEVHEKLVKKFKSKGDIHKYL
jgi:hypothetical protein